MAEEKKQDKKPASETKALVAVNEILKGEGEDETLERHRIEPEDFDKLLNNPKFVLFTGEQSNRSEYHQNKTPNRTIRTNRHCKTHPADGLR